jgi:acylphosphatase
VTEADHIGVEARISGRVQGVWYRAWTRDEARRLGLAGWVRNEADGSVRALFVGPEPAVRAMLALCRDGPPLAKVDQIETRPVKPVPDLARFDVRR